MTARLQDRGARIELTALPGFPMVQPGDDLGALIHASLRSCALTLEDGDILVVTQKIVSKAENRIIELASVSPSPRAVELALAVRKDPRLVEVILSETRRVVRARPDVLIVEHRLGFVMANAGVDQSNVGPADGVERALLLPMNPDASAKAVQAALQAVCGVGPAIVINDSFGRAWRKGTVGVAIGVAGLPALIDRRGTPDLFGRVLRVTEIGFADEIAAAASLLMGQADEGRAVVHVRGLCRPTGQGSAADLVRAPSEDLFR